MKQVNMTGTSWITYSTHYAQLGPVAHSWVYSQVFEPIVSKVETGVSFQVRSRLYNRWPRTRRSR